MPSKLYVGNLAYSVTNADLEQLFSQAGQVQSAAVIMDKFSGQSKGFGVVLDGFGEGHVSGQRRGIGSRAACQLASGFVNAFRQDTF